MGLIIFFTGISGAGKTTLSRKLAEFIEKEKGKTVTVLDGDEVRTWLSSGLGFTKDDRITNIKRVGRVAIEIGRHGGTAICALIAPYESAREEIKNTAMKHGIDFLEIFVHAPVKTVTKRDVKGLYKKSKTDKTIKMSGVDDVYERPISPDIVIDTSKLTVDESIKKIIKALPKD